MTAPRHERLIGQILGDLGLDPQRLTGRGLQRATQRVAEWEAMIEAPGNEAREEYEIVRDAVIEHLNPRDGDDGEAFLMVEGITYAAETLAAIPCSCPPDAGEPEWNADPCRRCQALGRVHDRQVDR